MKITKIKIHNFRSIVDAEIEVYDFLVLVGANNAGKSNVVNAIRCFYEDTKWTDNDFPKKGTTDQDSWVEISFKLSEDEWNNLADKYKDGVQEKSIILKRYFKGKKVKAKQSNIYAIVNGNEEADLFYGAKNIGTAKCGSVVYIPALTTPSEQMKTTGPSPLRNMLNFMLKKVVSKSPAYSQLGQAFDALNTEARLDDGFLTEISQPINSALSQWNVKIDLSVNPISPEEISKSLVKYAFVDLMLGDTAFDLDRFGHGFQRSLIYELIRIAPSFQDEKEVKKKEFNPDFTLLLFEEPEAFLHPAQQENMAYHLRRLGNESEQQVIISSHSPVFVSKSSDELCQICRIQKNEGVSRIYQLPQSGVDDLIKAGGDFLSVIKAYVNDPGIGQERKNRAQQLIDNALEDEIASQHERFRFQLWLDSDRASMFFADKVILVEGATEKALFNYLLANDWHDLAKERVLVVDALGKYNFHRFLSLFKTYGIYHGVMFDNDDEKNEHAAINQLIRDRKNEFTLADPFEFNKCLEKHLDLTLPGRDDQKPLQILKALEDKTITSEQITELRKAFCESLAIVDG
ncbi:ATP-dependent nuclease [Thiolapillus sp.]|uniref:ATP-dependent nuclease n=1 Tax=Thiolapillus sp. TaxID=2017437 RepID=UPI003AF768D5